MLLNKKRCCMCKKDISIDFFHKNRSNKDGYASTCKTCKSIIDKKYRENNTEKEILRHKIYREKHKDKCKASSKKWYNKNKEKSAEYQRDYISKNRDKARAYQREYYINNKDKIAGYAKKYYVKNKEKRYAKCFANRKLDNPNICEICNREGLTYGHHFDYSYPLEVLWVCPLCHGKIHRALRLNRKVGDNFDKSPI